MGVFLFNYFADVFPQRGNGSLHVSQMGASVHRICNFGEKKGVVGSEIYSTVMLIYSCELSETG